MVVILTSLHKNAICGTFVQSMKKYQKIKWKLSNQDSTQTCFENSRIFSKGSHGLGEFIFCLVAALGKKLY